MKTNKLIVWEGDAEKNRAWKTRRTGNESF